MQPPIRPFEDRDAAVVVDFSLRAWAPVFASLERVMGSEIFRRQHPDWREDLRRAWRKPARQTRAGCGSPS